MLKRLLAIWCCLALLWALPASADDMTLEEERKLGKEAFEEVRSHLSLVKDPDSLDYLRRLGERLIKERNDTRFKYRFYLADEPSMNAFALPGGWIFIFRGMITSMDTEGELAGVMAHEMSHVYYRHTASRMKKSGPVSVATIAGILAGILLGTLAGSPELGQAVTMGSMAGGIQKMLAFSREDEMQADYGAYKLLSAVGYDPAEMVKTFTRLWRTMRYTVSTPPPYLLTHPTSPQRAEALQNLVKRHPVSAKPYSNEEFLRIRTRLVALYDPSDSAETKFLRQAKADPKDPYPLYGLALVKMRLSQFKESLGLLGKLESKWPQNPHIWREQGLCFLNLGDYEKAQTFFNRCLSRRPQDQESLLGLGQSYLRMGRLEAARQTLSQLVQRHPDDDQAQYDLGVTLGRMGKTGEASLHLGLAFKERGNLHMAQYHLDRAKRELAGRPELLKQADKSLENVQKEAERRRKKAREQEDSSRRP